MKCSNCGAELSEGSKFCNNCGAQIQQQSQDMQREAQSTQDLMHDLAVALPIYQQISSLTDELERLYQKRNKKRNWLVTLLLLSVIWSLSWLLAIIPIFAILSIFHITEERPLEFALGIAFILAIVLTATILSLVEKRRKTSLNNEISNAEANVTNYIDQNACKELYCVPENYRYYIAVNYIYDCLRNCRASNLKEALNLYEEQLHRWQMEGYQQQILQSTQQQLSVSQKLLRRMW